MDQELETEIDYKRVLQSKYSAMLSDKIKKTYNVNVGPKSIFNQQLKSLNQGNYQSNFIITPALNQAISDRMIEEVTYSVIVTFNNTTANAVAPFPNQTIAINAYGNYATTNTLTSIFQNSTMTINQSKLLPLLQFNNDEHNLGRDFTSASNLDYFTDMNECQVQLTAGAPGPPVVNPTYATSTLKTNSLKSVFGNYGNDTFGNHGGFSCIQWAPLLGNSNLLGYDNTPIPANTNGATREVCFTLRSPIWNGLNSLLNKDENVFTGITNFQISKTVVVNMAMRLLKIRAPANLTVAGLSMNANGTIPTPIIYYNIYNFDESVPRPLKLYYMAHDYSNLQLQSIGNIPALSNSTFQSQPVNLSNIPSAIYVYIGPNLDNLAFANVAPQTYLENSSAPGTQINQIQVQYGGQNIIQNLSNAHQVYDSLSGSEGFMKTFAETGFTVDNITGTTQPCVIGATTAAQTATTPLVVSGQGLIGLYGSVCRIDISKLGLDWSKHSNGQSFTLPLQFSVNFTNLSVSQRQLYLYVQPIYDRLYLVDNANVVSTYNIVPDEVFNQLSSSALSVSKPNSLIGGSTAGRMLAGAWYDDLWSGIKSVGNVVKDGAEWAWKNKGDIADVAKTVLPMVGLGKKKKAVHRGRGFDESDGSDDEQHGGKIIPRSELQKKLKFI